MRWRRRSRAWAAGTEGGEEGRKKGGGGREREGGRRERERGRRRRRERARGRRDSAGSERDGGEGRQKESAAVVPRDMLRHAQTCSDMLCWDECSRSQGAHSVLSRVCSAPLARRLPLHAAASLPCKARGTLKQRQHSRACGSGDNFFQETT
eukprot:3234996-Rhodomonas_salina.1